MAARRGNTALPDASPAGRWPLLAAALLGALALLPRTAGLADYLTTDEAYHWIVRVERFSAAVSAGRWGDTLLTGHPGVTNMWLGSLGLALERALAGGRPPGAPELLAHLAWLRLPGAVLQSLLVPAAFLLLLRRVGAAAALAAGLLWACSPYLVAHSRLLHLDALLTSFVTFSVLLLLPRDGPRAKDQGPRTTEGGPEAMGGQAGASPLVLGPWSLVCSGACAGLALLTKGPALILLPFAGLLLLVWELGAPGARGARGLAGALLRACGRYAIWLGATLLVAAALWPALWADPAAALGRYAGEIVSNGGRANGDGQFFMGSADRDPGPLFYPAADLFRTTPLMLLGLACACGFWAADWGLRRPEPQAAISHRRALRALLAFALFWTLVMSLGPKKFDRYVLPAWPALLVLSGAGLARAGAALAAAAGPRRGRRLAAGGLAAAALAAELAQPLRYHPYYLSYYNPLLGGGEAAQRTFLIGWGEGMDQVGAWLSARPDIGYGPVLSALGRTLQPFVPVDVRDVEDLGRLPANYAVVYLESVQRGAAPQIYEALQTTVPLHRVVIHGIEYARIYQLPRPFATPLEAQFGAGLRLRGYTLERSARRITLTPAWDVRAAPGGDYLAFVHLLDASGARVAQLSVPPGGGEAPPTGAWQPGQQVAVPLPLDLPEGLPPGTYRLTLGLFDAASGARLPLAGGPAADPAAAGPDALLVATLELP